MLKKYFIQVGFEALTSLLVVSIKDTRVKTLVDTLLVELSLIVNVLTDDDKDNSTQLKELAVQRLYGLIKQLSSIGLELLKDKLTEEQKTTLNTILTNK